MDSWTQYDKGWKQCADMRRKYERKLIAKGCSARKAQALAMKKYR